MMGGTHGLAGLACAAGITAAATALGEPLPPGEILAVFTAATLTAEAADLDLRTKALSIVASTNLASPSIVAPPNVQFSRRDWSRRRSAS